jgi:transposase-like protein
MMKREGKIKLRLIKERLQRSAGMKCASDTVDDIEVDPIYGKPVTEIARDLDVSESALYR